MSEKHPYIFFWEQVRAMQGDLYSRYDIEWLASCGIKAQ